MRKFEWLHIDKELYHLVSVTIRNPRNTFSSRIGARTPVIPIKQAVLQEKPIQLINFLAQQLHCLLLLELEIGDIMPKKGNFYFSFTVTTHKYLILEDPMSGSNRTRASVWNKVKDINIECTINLFFFLFTIHSSISEIRMTISYAYG